MARNAETTGTSSTAVGRLSPAKVEQKIAEFHGRLKERGFKSTGQRDDIAAVFFELGRHVSAEELYDEVRKRNPHVGYATIYRTLKLLKECDLLYERHFDDAQARYEAAGEQHHDHFICERCGRIIEFKNDELERLQQVVARELGVALLRHKVELYGLCSDCRKSARN